MNVRKIGIYIYGRDAEKIDFRLCLRAELSY